VFASGRLGFLVFMRSHGVEGKCFGLKLARNVMVLGNLVPRFLFFYIFYNVASGLWRKRLCICISMFQCKPLK